jgi:outer membrane protein OmpA-like peptidoglycan-associated protein
MRVIANRPRNLFLLAMLALPASGSLLAQSQNASPDIPVVGSRAEGPEIKGFISARNGDQLQITTPGGDRTAVAVNSATRIKATSGLFGSGAKLGPDQLLNGIPVTIKTLQADGGLVATQISLKNSDFKTATMIRNGTDQRFAQHDQQIAQNAAATEALRGRVGDIDNYNIKATTNVNFDTGKAELTPQAQQDLCAAASTADGMSNALLLVVGYTDSTGSYDFNQTLSEKRATRVINYLQQNCHWKPYRMLTPTGMATADPLADNSTVEGRAQNRRVAVNVLVSKAVDGF